MNVFQAFSSSITLGVIAILCVLMLLGVFVCIFDHDDNHRNDKSSKE